MHKLNNKLKCYLTKLIQLNTWFEKLYRRWLFIRWTPLDTTNALMVRFSQVKNWPIKSWSHCHPAQSVVYSFIISLRWTLRFHYKCRPACRRLLDPASFSRRMRNSASAAVGYSSICSWSLSTIYCTAYVWLRSSSRRCKPNLFPKDYRNVYHAIQFEKLKFTRQD